MAAKTSTLARRAGDVGVGGVDEEFLADVAAPLAALCPEPSQRDAHGVQAALEWWLESLPALGMSLAPELEAVGEEALREAFARGRLVVIGRGERLQGENEEVRHYALLLLGSCRLRARGPAPKTAQAPKAAPKAARPGDDGGAGGDAADEALDQEGCVHVGTVRRGEPLGLTPGDARSPWEAVGAERSVVLLLGAEDYAATLKRRQKELHAEAVEFLQTRGVCPQATPFQLQRFVPSLRQRRVKRGTVLLRAGDFQRSVFILREGSCTLLSPPQEKPPPDDNEENPEEEDEEEVLAKMEQKEWEDQRLERLRATMHGGERQQRAAAEEARNAVLAKHARGNLGRAVRGEKTARPHPNLGVVARKDGLVATAVLAEPGVVVGEEVLLYDSYRDLVGARNCYTVIAEEDCLLYAVDITCFQKLASLIGAEVVIAKTQERMNRHIVHHSQCRKAAGQVTKDVRRTLRREVERQERQTLRLPTCYAGADPVLALENTDDWLQTVYDYRRAPKNDKNPATLQCLEGLGIDMGKGFKTGPGVGAMLEVFNRPAELKAMRSGQRFRRGGGGRFALSDSNPMGDIIPKEANFEETLPPRPGAAALMDEEPQVAVDEGDEVGFFFTELGDTAAATAPPPRARPAPPPSSDGGSPGASRGLAATFSSTSSSKALVRASSVPALPRLGASTASIASSASREAISVAVERRPAAISDGPSRLVSQSRKGTSTKHEAVVARAFFRTIVGKSVLVLTDKTNTKKGVMKAAQSALSEFELNFVKSTTDLWQRLNAPKESYHVVVLDLNKSELHADQIVRTLRGHSRYGKVPILVLSGDRELSEVVRASCSFVVFHPLAASMLREGLLWCLDRQALLPKKERQASCDRSPASGADDSGRMALTFSPSLPAFGLRGARAPLQAAPQAALPARVLSPCAAPLVAAA